MVEERRATSVPHRRLDEYGSRPCYGELIAIIVAGVLHVATEFTISVTAARYLNLAMAVGFLCYVVWRASTLPHVLKIWGMQFSNFLSALKAQLLFGIPAMLVLVAIGTYLGLFPPPATFWLAFVLYPLWGVAQQFALQNLVVRNLRTLIRPPIVRAIVAAVLFGLVHVPLMPIVALTMVAGFFLTLIYEYHPNIWAAGCVHGALGAMAFYFVLGRDPGARLLQFIFSYQG